MVEMVYVESSNLQAIGYDEIQQILYIEFKKSGTYQYFGVDKSIYDGYFSAVSIGKYFGQMVKKARYRLTKV